MHRRPILRAVALLLGLVAAAGAQTLARPGWKGSGMLPEAWWRSAVFYRIAPEHFQDSDGDGVGDLGGIAQRLDYLQALGVDAIVLQLPFDERGFDDLLAEATRRHIRLVIGLRRNPRADSAEGNTLAPEARHWLARGAAGILLPPPAAAAIDLVQEDALRSALRQVTAGYPGERVFITASASGTSSGQLAIVRVDVDANGQTLDGAAIGAALQHRIPDNAAPLLQLPSPEGAAHRRPAGPVQNAALLAAVLLTQRAAVMLEYGQELGLPAPERMPWIPSNVTPPPSPTEAASTSARPSGEIVYGPYRPYVPPPPKAQAAPVNPNDIVLPDPDTLPGFSSRSPSTAAGTEPVPSVVLQERDRSSTLNLYRELIALHHGNATLRNGSLSLLPAQNDATVWLRRAPAGARTVASVVIGVNTSDHPVMLSLASDFARLHVRAGSLRSLLPGSTPIESMSSGRLLLPPHGVFVGELIHDR